MEDFRDVANAKVHTATAALSATYSAMNQSIALTNPAVEGVSVSLLFYPELYDAYFYHSDHLGSSNYISNNTGIVSQHTEYLPFGETFVDEHLNSHNTPFKFNAKELDDETGNYYYGARYYNPKWSTWLSVDPLVEKYPAISPYTYVANNPINAIDPDGREIIILGSRKYRKRVLGELKKLAKSGNAGSYQYQMAIKSKKKFVIFDPKNENDHAVLLNYGGNYETLGFDLNQMNDNLDTANGHEGEELEQNAQTILGHELAHFNSDQDGYVIDEKGYSLFGADEVNAVEIENMIRKDLGLKLRTHYSGIRVIGKKIKERKYKYKGGYDLIEKVNYGKQNYIQTSNLFSYRIVDTIREQFFRNNKYLNQQVNNNDKNQTKICTCE
jgi:RHS repeat-associated protein